MRVLIIDDELDACKNIQYLLEKNFSSELRDIHIAHSCREAEELMMKLSYDYYFVDIEMPHESGIDFVSRKLDQMQNVIFVTAYDNYAIRAFRLYALDYILKPIDESIFIEAVDRAKIRANQQKDTGFGSMIKDIQVKSEIDKMVLRDSKEVIYVDLNDIIYLQADKAYTKVYYFDKANSKSFLLSHNLQYYEDLLESTEFNRVHKSYIVNKNHISKYYVNDGVLILKNEHTVPVSRRKLPLLKKWL